VRRLNPRRVKIHRSYTVDEAARLFRVHKNTVRAWLKAGLQLIDARRPILILGRDLAAFLHIRRKRSKQRCRMGQLYCLRCRAPKDPAGKIADYLPFNAKSGNLRALCPDCDGFMYRIVRVACLTAVSAELDVHMRPGEQRIRDNAGLCVNGDFDDEQETHADAQR
jgi:hypothetical protein